jgi:hypothetical protein
MLLEAGFISIFFAPSGFRPGWGEHSPPSRASLFLLQWEWFRIYFESGLVKLLSGDPEWRHLTAMDEYYQNNPLPTWIGWYLQHLPHWFHWLSALGTLVMELAIVWMMFLARRFRIICFFITTLWQLGVILTANYTFLNYLVLSLGFLLLDDKLLAPLLAEKFQPIPAGSPSHVPEAAGSVPGKFGKAGSCIQSCSEYRNFVVDLLRDHHTTHLAILAPRSVSQNSSRRAGPIPHRQSLWIVRCDDARSI